MNYKYEYESLSQSEIENCGVKNKTISLKFETIEKAQKHANNMNSKINTYDLSNLNKLDKDYWNNQTINIQHTINDDTNRKNYMTHYRSKKYGFLPQTVSGNIVQHDYPLKLVGNF